MSRKKFKGVRKDIKGNMKYVEQCPYCGGAVELQPARFVYPNWDKVFGMVWVCSNYPRCDSYVGCHPHTDIPLGSLADSDLRSLRHLVHERLDVLWKEGYFYRDNAYHWLAREMGIPKNQCHIGMFDEEMCHEAIRIVNRYRSECMV